MPIEAQWQREPLPPSAKVYVAAGDVATAEGTDAVLQAASAIGPIDILINNVGIFEVVPFLDIPDEEWRRFFDVNVLSQARLIQRVLPGMRERGYGRIINISSECGVRGLPQMVHYAVSKSAQLGLTRSVAELTKGTNITVNSVLPGPTWTEGVQEYLQGFAAERGISTDEATRTYFVESEPSSLIQRFVRSEEVAQAVLMTVANAAMNGASVRVEGGIIRSL